MVRMLAGEAVVVRWLPLPKVGNGWWGYTGDRDGRKIPGGCSSHDLCRCYILYVEGSPSRLPVLFSVSSPGRSSLTSGSSPSLLHCASLSSQFFPLTLNYISVWLLTWHMLYQASCVPRTLKRHSSQGVNEHLLCGLANTSVASGLVEGYLEKKDLASQSMGIDVW